jgi:hypothetical protein
MTKRQRELARIPGVKRVSITRGSHLRLELVNGRSVFTGLTPSNRFVLKMVEASVRRLLLSERRA